jgi:hypothetical protein
MISYVASQNINQIYIVVYVQFYEVYFRQQERRPETSVKTGRVQKSHKSMEFKSKQKW